MRIRRLSVPALAFVAGVALTPAAAMAATGLFVSSTTTPAVRAVNTTAAGPAVQAESAGTGNKAAVYARNTATGIGSNAFYARSYATSGEHYGMWAIDSSVDGAGIRGETTAPGGTGVLGLSPYGTGLLGVGGDAGVLSLGNVAADGHLLGIGQNIAGPCTVIATATSATCSFPTPFPTGIVPRVVVTPTGDPGGSFWVSSVTVNGFTVHTVAAAGVGGLTFDYVVVGVIPAGGGNPLALTAKRIGAAARK